MAKGPEPPVDTIPQSCHRSSIRPAHSPEELIASSSRTKPSLYAIPQPRVTPWAREKRMTLQSALDNHNTRDIVLSYSAAQTYRLGITPFAV